MYEDSAFTKKRDTHLFAFYCVGQDKASQLGGQRNHCTGHDSGVVLYTYGRPQAAQGRGTVLFMAAIVVTIHGTVCSGRGMDCIFFFFFLLNVMIRTHLPIINEIPSCLCK